MKTAGVATAFFSGVCLALLSACGGDEEGLVTVSSPTATPTASGAARYQVTVHFNTLATQDDIDEAATVLRAYDEDLEFIVTESFPPVGRAVVATSAPHFCQSLQVELEAKGYVDDISCRPP